MIWLALIVSIGLVLVSFYKGYWYGHDDGYDEGLSEGTQKRLRDYGGGE